MYILHFPEYSHYQHSIYKQDVVKLKYDMVHACIYFWKCHVFLMFPVLIQVTVKVEKCVLDVQILPNHRGF